MKNVFCILIVMLFVPLSMYSQEAPCDAGNTNCTAWSTTAWPYGVNLGDPDCSATLYMYTRVCNGVTEFYLSHYVLNSGCNGFDPALSYYNRNRNGLVEYLIQGAIAQNFVAPEDCPPNEPLPLINVFAASCGIWVCCTYELPNNPVFTCENGWSGPPPHTNTTPKTVTSCKWQSCGTQCCKRSYTVCIKTVDGVQTKDIKYISKVPLGSCSGAATFSPKPCQTDCQ